MDGKERMIAVINAGIQVHSGPGDYSKRAAVIAEALIADAGGRWHFAHIDDSGTEAIIQHPITERFAANEGNLFACQDGLPIIEFMEKRRRFGEDDRGKTFRIHMDDDHQVIGVTEVDHEQAGI